GDADQGVDGSLRPPGSHARRPAHREPARQRANQADRTGRRDDIPQVVEKIEGGHGKGRQFISALTPRLRRRASTRRESPEGATPIARGANLHLPRGETKMNVLKRMARGKHGETQERPVCWSPTALPAVAGPRPASIVRSSEGVGYESQTERTGSLDHGSGRGRMRGDGRL